jgi:hypothetical protein
VGLSVAGLAVVIGPSVGRALGGDGGGALRRILIRTAVAGAGTGITLLCASQGHGLDPYTLCAIAAANATIAAVIVLGVKDIVTQPGDLRELRVAPAVVGGAPGLVIGGRF